MRRSSLRPMLFVLTLAALLLGLGRPLSACAMEQPVMPCCPAEQHADCDDHAGRPAKSECGAAVDCLVPAATSTIVAAPAAERSVALLLAGAAPDAPPAAVATAPPRPPPAPRGAIAPPLDHAAATAARTWLLTARLRL